MLIAQNMDHAEFEYAEYGFCRILIKQNLDHAEFKCADRVEFGSSIFGLNTLFKFPFLRPNLHCGLCFLSGNADLFGLQHISE